MNTRIYSANSVFIWKVTYRTDTDGRWSTTLPNRSAEWGFILNYGGHVKDGKCNVCVFVCLILK